MSENNVEFIQGSEDILIPGAENFYIAAVFAGPDSTVVKVTRQGVSTVMMGVLASKLQVMYEVEAGAQHQQLLMQLAERAKMEGVALPEGVQIKRRRR